MSLVMLAGHPCSGKTAFAARLAEYMAAQGLETKLINEESLLINKANAFKDTASEKLTRAALKSAVDQSLGAKTVVILDSLNYIKGFRYELHCICKAQRASHCVVWVHCDDAVAEAWNKARPEADRYDPRLFQELKNRFEPPNPNNRWDFPLFEVDMTPSNNANATVNAPPEVVSSSSSMPLPDTVLTKVLETAAAASSTATTTEAATAVVAPVSGATKGSFRKVPKKGAPAVSHSTQEPSVDAVSYKLETSSLSTEAVPATSSAPSADIVALTFSGRSLDGSTASASTEKLRPEDCCEQVHKFLHSAVAPMSNPATVATPHASADLLYLLDKISQDVMKTIIAHQIADTSLSNPLVFREYDRVLELHRIVSMAELQRHRRHFIKVNTQIPPRNEIIIGSAFIDFLALQL